MKAFRIDVPDPILVDLRERLTRTRWSTAIPGAHWKYGADLDEVKLVCDYWRKEYDWRSVEARINKVPQFVTCIDGLWLHFLYARAPQSARMPLLLLHGWPGSVVEYFDLVAPLTSPEEHVFGPAFDVVIPSLPGFGFSGKPNEAGWHADQCASVLHRLMTEKLGYSQYGIQGGDWGTIIGTRMAHTYARHIRGLHINMPFAYPPDPASADAREFAARMELETGYLHLQNTKPDSIAIAQADSPAGLAGWILEKFRSWSDCDGKVLEHFSMEMLTTNLMLYWVTNSSASAARIYFESTKLDPPLFCLPRIEVPTAIAAFPKEPFRSPRDWVTARYNIVSWTDMPSGGHFPALEEPALLLKDMRHFFRSR